NRQVWKRSTKLIHPVERAYGDDDTCMERSQFPRKLGIATDRISFGGPHDEGIVRPFDETFLLKAFPKRGNSIFSGGGIHFLPYQKPDQRHVSFCLGKPRSSNTQRGHAHQSDEITPLHARPPMIRTR